MSYQPPPQQQQKLVDWRTGEETQSPRGNSVMKLGQKKLEAADEREVNPIQ
jgi:hypothetical protein